MIPARMGSQRLSKKNLRTLGGVPLITRAIRKCKTAGVFDEVWVNSEAAEFGEIAQSEGARFHQRPAQLADHVATSEQYVEEFLRQHECECLLQIHSIAPLLSVQEIRDFVGAFRSGGHDTLLSYEAIQIECALNGQPVNFDFDRKTNSQDLSPVQRITWSITGWRRVTYLAAAAAGRCATYSGHVGFYELSRNAAHVVKTAQDLDFAEAILKTQTDD